MRNINQYYNSAVRTRKSLVKPALKTLFPGMRMIQLQTELDSLFYTQRKIAGEVSRLTSEVSDPCGDFIIQINRRMGKMTGQVDFAFRAEVY